MKFSEAARHRRAANNPHAPRPGQRDEIAFYPAANYSRSELKAMAQELAGTAPEADDGEPCKNHGFAGFCSWCEKERRGPDAMYVGPSDGTAIERSGWTTDEANRRINWAAAEIEAASLPPMPPQPDPAATVEAINALAAAVHSVDARENAQNAQRIAQLEQGGQVS